jgi:asparagine synthase (glutamine-hydrolysing)
MCGIAGQWVRRSQFDPAQMSAALQAMTHRGPNDCGQDVHETTEALLNLGHTRLSIIDLTSGGHQPMFREHGRYSLVYNGEIYNYRELRGELAGLGQQFRSESDGEVLLAAWCHWKRAALPRLKGMFAFAVHDRRDNTLTLARDAFGIKPLFYSAGADRFAFASEVPALLRLRGDTPSLNLQRAYDYLVFGSYDDSENTFFADVSQLGPGHVLTVDLASGRVVSNARWWWPEITRRSSDSFETAAETIREMFLANVRLHLRSDVPLGAALSGGIDSSSIVCGMRIVEPHMPIHTFSYAARGSAVNEERWADMINEHVGAIPHKVVATPEELSTDLADMIRAQGEPFGSTSIYAQYRVFKLAREHGITVTLEGQGADELFGGYRGYPGPVLRGLLESGRLVDAAQFAAAWSRWPDRSMWQALLALGHEAVPDRLRSAALTAVGRPPEPPWLDTGILKDAGVVCAEPVLPADPDAAGRRLAATLRTALTRRGLAALLRHGDRNSMRWSIESRVPFLTPDLADYALSLPEEYLVSRTGETKRVFRAAMRGIVPDSVLNRRDKIGFATPEEEWFRSIASAVRQWLSDDVELPFLDQRRALQEYDRVIAGQQRFSWQVWRWINFTQWYRMFFQRAAA